MDTQGDIECFQQLGKALQVDRILKTGTAHTGMGGWEYWMNGTSVLSIYG